MPTATRSVSLFLLAAVLAALGCRGSTTVTGPPPREQVLTRLYGQYIQANKGKPPANADQLKAFARKLSADDAKKVGIDTGDVDSVFTSQRDGKPFVFRDPGKASKGATPDNVVIYEQEGSRGKRLVIYPMGKTEEVDAARFKELVPEAK